MRFTSDPWCPHSPEDTTSKRDVGHPDELMAETVEAGMQGGENHMFIIVYHLELPPTQDASHHHDYEPFLVWNPEQTFICDGILGGG